MPRSSRLAAAVAVASLPFIVPLAQPQPAAASILDKACGIVGTIGEGWWGKACKVVAQPGKVIGVVKKVVTGKPGQAAKVVLGGAGKNALSLRGAVGIAAIVAWAVGGAHFVLSETAKLVGQSTSPELTAAWFSSVYWRVAGVGVLLTLPFLVAAAIQAVLRSDGALLARAVFGYLPLSFLATGVAAPVAMMLLQLTDWMGVAVARAAGDQGSHFLVKAGVAIGALGVAVGSPFVTFLIALLTAAGGLTLWLELLVREAAVYVVVLMLPLVFAAMVWPARRVWAIRSVEVLVALILAKFAIVSVLALAAAALGHGGGSLIVRALAGLVLVMLGAFAPWVLLRLLPLAEVASAAAGHVRDHALSWFASDTALGRSGIATVGDGVSALMARMQSFQADGRKMAGASGTDKAADGAASIVRRDVAAGPSGGGGATGALTVGEAAGGRTVRPSATARSHSAPRVAGSDPPTRPPPAVSAYRPQPGHGPDISSPDMTDPPMEPEPPTVEDEAQPTLPPPQPDEGEDA